MNDTPQTQPPQPTMHQQVAVFIHNALQTAPVQVSQMETMAQALKWLELVGKGNFIVIDQANPTAGLAPVPAPAETPDPAEPPPECSDDAAEDKAP